jgi:hypothetical protein
VIVRLLKKLVHVIAGFPFSRLRDKLALITVAIGLLNMRSVWSRSGGIIEDAAAADR